MGHTAGTPGMLAWADGVDQHLSNLDTTTNTNGSSISSLQTSKVSIADRPVSLHGQPGIDWTGATDSSAAIQSVLDAADTGAKIDLGVGGKIRCDTGLTLHNFQTLEGPANQIGTGIPATIQIDFSHLPASAVGITGAASNVVRNVLLLGPGYTASSQTGWSSTTSSARFEGVQFYQWPTGVSLTGAYYASFINCEWSSCAVGLKLSGCYDLDLFKPRFRCSDPGRTTFGSAIVTGTVRGINVFGGSIEDFGAAAGVNIGADSTVNLFGTYFESGVSGAAGIGITAANVSGTAVGLYGCMVYLTNLNRWVNFGGGTAQSLVAIGNKFSSTSASTTTPYAYTFSSTGTANVEVTGDNWYDVAKGIYLGGTVTLPANGYTVAPPIGAANANVNYLGLIKLVQQAAQADTTGATLTALETEVNGLKAKLRTLGLMAP